MFSFFVSNSIGGSGGGGQLGERLGTCSLILLFKNLFNFYLF